MRGGVSLGIVSSLSKCFFSTPWRSTRVPPCQSLIALRFPARVPVGNLPANQNGKHRSTGSLVLFPADQVLVGEPPACHAARQCSHHADRVHAPDVVPPGEFVDVAEQVLCGDVMMRAAVSPAKQQLEDFGSTGCVVLAVSYLRTRFVGRFSRAEPQGHHVI